MVDNTTKKKDAFDIKTLKNIKVSTPFFVFSEKVLEINVKEYKRFLPHCTEICYSMKANSEKIVLQTLKALGINFEVASKHELRLLKPLKVSSSRIIYGSSVKDSIHIKEFVRYGVDRFACDSQQELFKIRKYSPSAKVYIRTLVDDKSDSVFHMSEKFGVSIKESIFLLTKARDLGMIPYGISFNVGSQAKNEYAWARGIVDTITIMKTLLKENIKIKIINIGGGFPHKYKNFSKVPTIKQIVKHIDNVKSKLPYNVNFVVEPGRGLVANTYVLIVSIIEKIKRYNGYWLYLDAGVYNALLEVMTCQGSIRYNISPLKTYPNSRIEKFILTGPACDDLDVIDENALLPVAMQVGDRLAIYNTGAYTFTLTTRFNGYPKPKVVILK